MVFMQESPKDHSDLWRKFLEETKNRNKIRQESFRQVFEEFSQVAFDDTEKS